MKQESDLAVEKDMLLRRRLCNYVSRHFNDAGCEAAIEVLSDVITDADAATVEEILEPVLLEYNYGPHEIAAAVLALPSCERLEIEELVEQFEAVDGRRGDISPDATES